MRLLKFMSQLSKNQDFPIMVSGKLPTYVTSSENGFKKSKLGVRY